MTERATLWIKRPMILFERVGGMGILERQLQTMGRAGIKKVWLNVKAPDPRLLASIRIPEKMELVWADKAGKRDDCATPYLGVSGEHFIRPETLAFIAQASYPVPVSFIDSRDLSAVQVVPYRSEDEIRFEKHPLPEGSAQFLEPPVDGGTVLQWLFSFGPKPQDGFMARHFDRHISLAFSRRLIETPVSANMMTVASSMIGLIGALSFSLGRHPADVLGAGLVWAHSVLDGCDGELARIRMQESRLGGILDFWGDNLVHLALFASLGVGLSRSTGQSLPLLLGAAAAAGVIGSATLAFWQKQRRKTDGALLPASDGLSRLENMLAQRDFIYLLVVMAYWKMTYAFLWAGAVGAPLFFVGMLAAVKTAKLRTQNA